MIKLSESTSIPARYVNRHCLITGPTGTGKTVTLLRLVESLTSQGVAVFAPDVKGDLIPYGDTITTARAPVWAFGADLLSRALELSEVQAGALEIAFAYANGTAAPLDTLSNFRALLASIAANPDSVAHLGHVTKASIGTIQRALLRLESQGADSLFGCDVASGHGFDVGTLLDNGKTILDASRLYHSPRLYGAFLLFVLRDLARRLPEVGDLDRPRLVLVFDEAHTIFHEASPALLRSIEATARLIRSKGVGLVWASQSPNDIPAIIRDQCATTLEHKREYGVGRAMFTSLDTSGKPTAPRMISPDMVAKPEPQERPPAPSHSLLRHGAADTLRPRHEPEPTTFAPDMRLGYMALAGFAVLALIGLAIIGAGFGGSLLAIAAAVIIATR